MTRRVLPPEEWDRITDPATRAFLPNLRPDMDDIVVVESDGKILASWVLLETIHVEGVYTDPACRGQATVLFALLAEMKDVARSKGHRRVMTTAATDEVGRLCRSLKGELLPGMQYSIPVEE